jgi:hypothetical protein
MRYNLKKHKRDRQKAGLRSQESGVRSQKSEVGWQVLGVRSCRMDSRISAWAMVVSCHRWPSIKGVDLNFAAVRRLCILQPLTADF